MNRSALYIYILLFHLFRGILWAEPIQIPLISYHTHPPFIVEEGNGLTYDLADYLNDKAEGIYQFEVIPMSRPKLDLMLEEQSPSIIPWVNPAWFKDVNENIYLWTESVLMNDGIAIISNRKSKIEYLSSVSLENLRFGGLQGHNYSVVDPLVEKGCVVRYDSDNHIDNFRKLISGRIDFCITPLSGAIFLVKEYNMEQFLYISYDPDSYYSRRIIISHKDLSLQRFLNDVIKQMPYDLVWQSNLAEYME